ncbi:hypothetical protein [Aurantimonas sp. HBX-1]|uniref:hypothetical protein n=1 Tax=Aurantimonas sp. HBX-1 TaxID=2906072 RepID=UPI001F23E90D|nr:hypothetical protein [Aurantimonas sp. HBX-1]UIJ71923.1 hypothetical protein LXB15_19945 [Aurantimonas sp. HBX-1]
MKLPLAIVTAALLLLTGCQTVEEVATADVMAVCTEGGYGPGTRYHDYCISQLKPFAVRLEQQRRQQQVARGLSQIAEGLNPPSKPKVTCIQSGAVTRCY